MSRWFDKPSPAAAASAVAAALLTLAVGVSWRAWAQQPDAGGPMEFIRVHVPQAKIHELASQRPPNYYLPMKRQQFEAALAKLRTKQRSAEARVGRAVYAGRLVETADEAAISGRGQWSVELEQEESGETILPVGECGIAIERPEWSGEPAAPADLGLDDQQRLSLAVPRGGDLSFNWSLRAAGKPQPDTFELRLPNAAAKVMLLALPLGITPVLDIGVATDITDDTDDIPEPLRDVLLRGVEDRVWRLELGGVASNRLQLRRELVNDAPERTFRQDLVYRLSLSGLELQVDLQFDEALPDELLLSVSPELRLDARLGETAIPLENAGPQQMLLRLPSGRPDTVIRLLGVAELPLGVLWTMPKVIVENARWREGETRVLVSDQLRLRHLRADGCRQTDRRRQPDGREELRFREESETADLRLDVAERRRALSSRSGATIRWGEEQLTAVVESEFTASWGDVFTLSFQVPPGWEIDAVETEPQDALDIEQLQLQPIRSVLTVPLIRAVSPQAAIRVKIQAHREVLAGQRVSGRSLLIGRPLNAAHQGYLAFRGELFNDAALARVAPNVAEAAGLIEPLSGGVVIRDDRGLAELMIRKPPLRPEYRADVTIVGEARQQMLEERYEVRCVPEAGSIARVRIQTSEPIEPLRWSVDGEGPVAVTRAENIGLSEPEASAASAAGRRWDLALARPLSTPFTLRAAREQPLDGEAILGLISVPEAISQTGAVEIANTEPLLIDAAGLERLPVESPQETVSPLQAAFRYEPATPVPVRVQRLPEQAGGAVEADVLSSATAQAWSMRLLSRFETSGRAQHVASILLANQGLDAIQVAIPAGCRVLRATVDQQPAPVALSEQTLRVRLPKAKRHVFVQITYTSDTGPVGWRGSVRAPLLGLSVPVMDCHWSLDLPPGYDLAPGDRREPPRLRGWPRVASRLTMPFSALLPTSRSDADVWQRAIMLLHQSPDIETWGELLLAAKRRLSSLESSTLLVDRASLADLQIGPETPLTRRHRSLSDYGLGVFADRNGLILTHVHRRPQAFGVAAIPDGEVIDRWAAEAAAGKWLLELPGQARVDQQRVRRDLPIGAAALATGAANAGVRRLATIRAMMICTLLVSAGLAWVMSLDGAVRWWAVGWLAAWLAPAPWAWCGAAVGWGALLGVLLRIVRLPRPAAVWQGRPLTQFAGNAAVLLVAVSCGSLLAQPPAELPPLYRVLIPIGDDGKPAGENLSVPLPLWRALEGAGRDNNVSSVGWLLTGADHELAPEEVMAPADDEPVTLTLTSRYRLRVFRASEEVGLPVSRADGPVVTAVLDGVDTNFRWNNDGSQLMVPTILPGVYELEVTRRIEDEAGEGVSVVIPALPASTVSLDATELLRDAKLPTAAGSISRSAGRVFAQLGATRALAAVWDTGSSDAGVRQVEEHLWLQVKQVDSVVLRSLFRYQADEDLQTLRLLADDRLRLLTMKVDGEEVAPDVQQREDGVMLLVTLPAGRRSAELAADFHVKGVSGVGRLRPPQLRAISQAASRRWFAVSVAPPDLTAEFSPEADLIDSQEFTVSWPDAQGPLLAAKTGDGRFDVHIRYADAVPVADQVSSVTVTAQRTHVDFDAVLQGIGGSTFQHVLRVPAKMVIESLTVHEGEEDQLAASRHELDDAGNLTVFLERPAAASQRLQLRGRLPVTGAERRLPQVRLVSAAVSSERIELYRSNEIGRVEIRQTRQLEVDKRRAGEFVEGSRLVAELTAVGPENAASLRTQPNRRQATADTTMLLKRDAGQWLIELRGQVVVQSGILDELRLRSDVPLELSVVSPASLRLSPMSEGNGSQWVLIPDRPVVDSAQIVLEAPLPTGSDGVLRAPDLSLLDVTGRRFLALPREAEGRQIRWATPRGLQAASPSQDSLNEERYELFEVVDRRFEATLQRTERISGSPIVLLADIYATRSADGCHGMAIFDLEPAGRRACAIATPDRCELLAVTVNGVRAPAERLRHGNWQVQLGSNDLPQRIVATYRSSNSAASIPAPTIVGLETVRTTWTVTGELVADSTDSPTVSAYQQELWRTETICTLLNSAADVASNHPMAEIRRWYEPWARRLVGSEAKLQRLAQSPAETDRAAAFVDLHGRVAEQLRVAPQLAETRGQLDRRGDVSDVRLAAQKSRRPLRFASQGAAAELPVAKRTERDYAGVWLWLLASAGALLVTWNSHLEQWLLQWPELFLASIGVALIVGLPSPWIGSAVLALAMLRSLGQRP